MVSGPRAFAVFIAVCLCVAPSEAAAQDRWQWDIELGGSTFFGDVDQTAFSTSAGVSRTDSLMELSGLLAFDYGETTDRETDQSVVSRRSWLGAFGLDWRPLNTWSPFVFGTGEQSFQKRIDFRYNAGLGVKYTLESNDTTRIDLSGAGLAEQTFPTGDETSATSSDAIMRLSVRLRLRHTFGSGDSDEDLTFNTSNFYAPRLTDFGNYTITSRTNLDYPLTGALAIGLLFQYDYDSLSEARGATSNHTGKLFVNFGVEF